MADKQSQAPTSSSTFGQHDNAYVPHHISDHTKALQMSVRTENGWVNISDTLDQMNDHKDLYVVHDQVEKAQEDIVNAQSSADYAVNRADSAVKTASVTSDTVSNMSDAVKTATADASDAVAKAEDALADMDSTKKQLTASITSNADAIALKADKVYVDRLNSSVNEHSASISVLNDKIKNVVTESTVENLLDKKGYATQTYTQGLVTQTAKTWGANLTKLTKTVDGNQSATVKQMTDLQASIDGIQGTVTDNEKQTESKITELSDSISTKVSDALKNSSTITQLENNINLKVSKDDLISQINLEAGRTLIESNKIYLDADSVVFGKDSKAFIPSAAITEINADKITTGTLKGINIYGNDIVSFNKDESEQYSFVQIDEGGIYLGEAAKPDPSLIDYTERIGYTKVARIYSSKDADLTLVGNQINVKAPNYIHTSSDGTEYSTRTNLIINTVQPKNHSITTSAAGLFITSQLLKSSKNSGYNEELFGKVLTSRYETNESVWQSEANQIGAISGVAMDEDYLALQAPKKVTVNLSGGDSESSFDVQKNSFFTASFGADGSHDGIQLTANGRIGFHSLRANTIYFDHGDHGATHDSLNTCLVFGNFGVLQGQKNSIVKTSQGLTAIHAYETAEYYFGDIGESNTSSNSKVIVGIDQLFGQTVNTDVEYQVFLTPYSEAHVWVEKRYNNRFVVCSDQPNAQFGWELKARRKGYEHTRLTNFSQQIQ